MEVYDGAGSLRALIGQQPDGTTGVNVVNGPPPAQPTAPIVASVLGGVTVSWDGGFADGYTVPLDWSRLEVHASTDAVYDPNPATLRATIETAQGATVVVPCDTDVYVQTLARNTSGAASPPTAIVGPFGPAAVVASDVLDGIVTTVKLADDVITQAKIALGAVTSAALADGAVLSDKLAVNAVTQSHLAADSVTSLALASEAVTAAKVAVSAIDSSKLSDAAVTAAKLAAGSVQTAALAADSVAAGKIASDAITARELAANAVTAAEISAGAVTASALAAGSVTAEKLTIGSGANLLSDPSFEGAYSAALVAGDTYFSIDSTGNGSAKSLRANAAATSAVTRSKKITTVPILPADQLYIAFDYLASSNYTSTAIVKVYARWEDASGTTLGYGAAQASPPVLGGSTWNRPAATVTAPAGTVQATIWAESYQASAGTVWWDNVAVRPVMTGVQIADGTITTPKLVAGAVTTDKLTALSVTAEKIAALAVTTEKIAALAVTADQLAANSVTAAKIAAGSVDATHIKAGAITADKLDATAINGKTITGAVIRALRADGSLAALMAPDLGDGDGEGGFQTESADGTRIARLQNGELTFSTKGVTQAVPTGIAGTANPTGGVLDLNSGFLKTNSASARITLASGDSGYTTDGSAFMYLGWDGAGPDMQIDVSGIFLPRSFAWGRVTVSVTTANTPASVTVTGLNVRGSTFQAFATALTSTVGTVVTGVGTTSITTSSVTVWANRSSVGTVQVAYLIIGK
ncbi:hypothetical protein [Streptomyces sp. NPDC002172]